MKNERTQFRPLNQDEIHLIEVCVLRNMESYRLLGFSDSSTFGKMHSEAQVLVQYSHLGSGFTVCTLLVNNQIKVGASRCSHRDRPNRIKGEMLALRRAIVSKAPPINLYSSLDLAQNDYEPMIETKTTFLESFNTSPRMFTFDSATALMEEFPNYSDSRTYPPTDYDEEFIEPPIESENEV